LVIHHPYFSLSTVINHLKPGPLKDVLLRLRPHEPSLHDIPESSTLSDEFRSYFQQERNRKLLTTIGPLLVKIDNGVFHDLGIGWCLDLMKQHYLEDRDGSLFGARCLGGARELVDGHDDTGGKSGALQLCHLVWLTTLSVLSLCTHLATNSRLYLCIRNASGSQAKSARAQEEDKERNQSRCSIHVYCITKVQKVSIDHSRIFVTDNLTPRFSGNNAETDKEASPCNQSHANPLNDGVTLAFDFQTQDMSQSEGLDCLHIATSE